MLPQKANSPDLYFLYFHLFSILLLHLDFHPSIPQGPKSLKVLSQCRTYSLDKVFLTPFTHENILMVGVGYFLVSIN